MAKEQARLAKEREKARQQQHLESQQREVERRTAAIERQVRALDELLTSVLSFPPFSFEQLMVFPRVPPFDPGSLGLPIPSPEWEDFAPIQPKGLSRILGGAARYDPMPLSLS